MPLVTFDGRDAEDFKSILDFGIDTAIATTTGSNSITRTRSFTVTGNGLLYVSGSVYADATSDTGSIYADVIKGNTTYARNGNRFTSASAMSQSGQVSCLLQVSDGDVVQVRIQTTKNGSKTFYWYHLGIGCSAVQSGG